MKGHIRRHLAKVVAEFDRIHTEIGAQARDLRTIADEMREEYNGKSDDWQESEAGQHMETEVTAMESAADSAEAAESEVENIVGQIQEMIDG